MPSASTTASLETPTGENIPISSSKSKMTKAKINTADLDPAAAAAIVFNDELLKEISQENARLRDDVAHIRPLLDHIQRVDLIAAVNDKFVYPLSHGPLAEDGCDSTAKIETIATVQLCDGIIRRHKEMDKLIIPVESSHEIMVRNLSFFGGIGVSIAEHSVGFFPRTSSGNVAHATSVGFTEDDEAELSVYISENVCIKGALNNLSNEDFMKFKQNYVTETGYKHDIFCCNTPPGAPHLTFVPKTIVMNVTPTLAETLDLVAKANATTGESLSPSDELRSLTLGVIGSEAQKRALNENLMLKAQLGALGKVRDKIMRVDIAHCDGIVSFSLDEGELETDEHGDLVWKIRLEGKEHTTMPVHSIRNSSFSVSGSIWNIKDLYEYVPQRGGCIVATETNPLFGLTIPYYYGIEVVGAINCSEQSEEDLPELQNSYHQKVFASMSRMMTLRDDSGDVVNPFPDTFRLELLYVTFRPNLIKDILNMVGCDDLLATEGIEESTAE